MYKQLNLVPIYNIIFMSGAHGVAGWVWGGGGCVSVDRWLFHVVADFRPPDNRPPDISPPNITCFEKG